VGEEMYGFVVEGVRLRGRPKRTWKEVVEGDMKSLKLSKEDALVRSKWPASTRLLVTVTLLVHGLESHNAAKAVNSW